MQKLALTPNDVFAMLWPCETCAKMSRWNTSVHYFTELKAGIKLNVLCSNIWSKTYWKLPFRTVLPNGRRIAESPRTLEMRRQYEKHACVWTTEARPLGHLYFTRFSSSFTWRNAAALTCSFDFAVSKTQCIVFFVSKPCKLYERSCILLFWKW